MIQINIHLEKGGFRCEFDEEPLLRDLFAACALAGLNAFGDGECDMPIDAAVGSAYHQADKMIERRKEASEA